MTQVIKFESCRFAHLVYVYDVEGGIFILEKGEKYMRAKFELTVVKVELQTNDFHLRKFTHEIFPDEFEDVDWFGFYKQVNFFFNSIGLESHFSCPDFIFTIHHFAFVNEVKNLKSTIQRNIVDMFFGLSEDKLTMKEIADRLEITPEEVSKVLRSAKNIMRKHSKICETYLL